MRILLNGEPHELGERLSVADFLERLGLDRERVGVELNRRILKRSELDDFDVGEGDELEVVTFVGGG